MEKIQDSVGESMKKLVLYFNQGSQKDFAEEIGVGQSTLNAIIVGRSHPGYSFLRKLVSRYDNINLEWLIKGEGEMLKEPYTTGQKLYGYFPKVEEEKIKTLENELQKSQKELDYFKTILSGLTEAYQALSKRVELVKHKVTEYPASVAQFILATDSVTGQQKFAA